MIGQLHSTCMRQTFSPRCCVVLPLCPDFFSHVESCSVDFEGSQKRSVDEIKFLLSEDVEAYCSVVLPLQLDIVQSVHAHLKRNRPKSCVLSIKEEMFTGHGQCSVVLPHPKLLLCPHSTGMVIFNPGYWGGGFLAGA